MHSSEIDGGDPRRAGVGRAEVSRALRSGPAPRLPGHRGLEARPPGRRPRRSAFSMFENATTAIADVVLPLETHAEKDGTVTHPDGRLQRVRPSASRPGDIRPNVQVLADLSSLLGHDTGIHSQPSAFAALTDDVAFYAGIDGLGHRRPRASAGRTVPRPRNCPPWARRAPVPPPHSQLVEATSKCCRPKLSPPPAQNVRRGYRRPRSSSARTETCGPGPITELNPPLRFLTPQQRVELSPADAERLELRSGDEVSCGPKRRPACAPRSRSRSE